jgi:choline kinase
MKAVIIAAGQSSRLWSKTNQTPKTLLPFKKGTILSKIISNLKKCGIREIVLVVGWKKAQIKKYIMEQQSFGVSVEFVDNPQWKRGNGISVLAASKAVGIQPFLLSMCDHIVTPKAIRRLKKSKRQENLLLVDKRVTKIFDIDDATKVVVKKKKIRQIGKELADYNGIDCGIFRLDYRFFECMENQLKEGRDSISAAVTGLIEKNEMAAVFMKKRERWIDIDTPEAYQFAVERKKTV